MRPSATVVDVHTAPKGSEPLHGIGDHLLLVEELAKRTLEVPLFGHQAHPFTEHVVVVIDLALVSIGRVAHLLPEAMQMTMTHSTRAVPMLRSGRNPCFDVLLLAEQVPVA